MHAPGILGVDVRGGKAIHMVLHVHIYAAMQNCCRVSWWDAVTKVTHPTWGCLGVFDGVALVCVQADRPCFRPIADHNAEPKAQGNATKVLPQDSRQLPNSTDCTGLRSRMVDPEILSASTCIAEQYSVS